MTYLKIVLKKENQKMEQKIILLEEKNQEKIEKYMPNKQMLFALSNLFGAFSDSTRLKILTALSLAPMCVNDLSVLLKINQTTCSHQLKNLKELNLVRCIRHGKIILYSASGEIFNNIMLESVNHLIG